ncbi:MAG: MBL fold metallo-hydrolase [Planctomycetota bacterium]|nr:MBL fold metallo-hydrolase [Planctomycetota bacterium]MDG1986108.1 MBL fold metallo-hydrolase [Planctomycetota bacterium]
MRLRLLPSSFPGSSSEASPSSLPAQPLTSFVVEGRGAGPLAIDAGSVGLFGEPAEMGQIRGLVLTHAHIDHVASLPMWVEGMLSLDRAPVRVHASGGAIHALRAHLFSGPLFPDFEALREADGRPLMELVPFPEGEPFELAGFDLRAFPVAHPVPTHGLLVDDGQGAILFGADSGPCDRLWEAAAEAPRLRAVVLEASFPERMQAIADGSGHLTPATLAAELERVPEGVRVLLAHLKPAYRGEIIAELSRRVGDAVEFLEPGAWVDLGQ